MGPYKKIVHKSCIDDGWGIEDGEGCLIAVVETEHMADILISVLQGPTVAEFAGGLLQYVEDGSVIEVRECGFIQELLEAVSKGTTNNTKDDC